jgi:hypothetical protein
LKCELFRFCLDCYCLPFPVFDSKFYRSVESDPVAFSDDVLGVDDQDMEYCHMRIPYQSKYDCCIVCVCVIVCCCVLCVRD